MRIVFAGTPVFARAILSALIAAGHDIVAVLTQPDRLAGRGQNTQMSPVKEAALQSGLRVLQPQSLREGRPGADEAKAVLRDLKPDLMIVVAYGLILPKDILELPRHGCMNIHASLLPRWRGAAPIQRAIQAGDQETGIALMKMEEGLDTGPVWLMHQIAIAPNIDAGRLHDQLMTLAEQSVVDFLKTPVDQWPAPVAQPLEGVTYAHKISKEETLIDWTQPASQIACHIRAFDPFPGAMAKIRGDMLKLGGAQTLSDKDLDEHKYQLAAPGEILKADRSGLYVKCGHGAISVGEVQRPGGRRLSYRDFLNGYAIAPGDQFDLVENSQSAGTGAG